jgi:hypothetical protein
VGVSSTSCACGNPGTIRCQRCIGVVCALCVRRDDNDLQLCLACRAGQIEREEAAARKSLTASGRATIALLSPSSNTRRIRRKSVLFPAVIVVSITAMAAVAVPVLSDAHRVRAERRATDALHAIFVAETGSRRPGHEAFLTLEELRAKRLVEWEPIPEYQIKVELSRDRKNFWVQAFPSLPGLRTLYMDTRGEVQIEGD